MTGPEKKQIAQLAEWLHEEMHSLEGQEGGEAALVKVRSDIREPFRRIGEVTQDTPVFGDKEAMRHGRQLL